MQGSSRAMRDHCENCGCFGEVDWEPLLEMLICAHCLEWYWREHEDIQEDD